MLGAHLDSWHGGTGATDNAAGSAIAMEAIRILKATGIKPRRTIRIGLWSGEEEGLLGSKAYVKDHFGSHAEPTDPKELAMPDFLRKDDTPLTLKADQAKVSAYFNVDNGTGKIRGVYLQENESVSPIFHDWMQPFSDLGMTTLSMRDTGSTDHVSFDAVGIPGFQFIQDPVEYMTRTHHSNEDVYERIQRDDMMQAAVVLAGYVYDAAMRDTAPALRVATNHTSHDGERSEAGVSGRSARPLAARDDIFGDVADDQVFGRAVLGGGWHGWNYTIRQRPPDDESSGVKHQAG